MDEKRNDIAGKKACLFLYWTYEGEIRRGTRKYKLNNAGGDHILQNNEI